ncbi:GMC oxidoreductase family protein Mala s 12 [Psilocybe cubensis]|uniref:pyranose dehydrogenase (acceptor) n=2 Tax=Psilocybe cubensis TaxID=181762 RepID=A0A8H7XRF2_PSICU|nr:GMC oxidoreductase family protein Mala s 12 [Psilocybe cubensis]KAH9479090.1 GMC oxidoreductase family protein Mala s 12 [Psilocybe cubensis]
MRYQSLILAAFCGCGYAQLTPTLRHLHSRAVITDTDLRSTYDYIIVGGGLAGLVVASRLSEDSSTTVLVLEAGHSGDDVIEGINSPSGAYYSSIVGTEYDWLYVTTPQTHMNNRSVGWPRGKILGGSSAMNAMYLVRPAKVEVDAWQAIINDDKKRWGWDNLFKFMKKAENFTPPTEELLSYTNISYDASTHGSGGPMQVTYPAFMIGINNNWTSSLEQVGVPTLTNPNGGITLGGFIAPSSINPSNWTRSYSRSAYIDPLPPRPNLHILPDATVLRLRYGDSSNSRGIQVTGVEFAKDPQTPISRVDVKKEVILSGGPLGTPKVLLHSGVGPRDVLEAANIDVRVTLPGVGQHLQDHLTAGVVWETPQETAGNIKDSGSDFSRTAEFLSFINDAVAFVNVTALFGGPDPVPVFQKQIIDAMEESSKTLVPSIYPEVVEGYKAIYETTANKFLPDVAQLEMLMSLISPGTVSIQAALQHPFSTGRTYINSSNPFDPIIIDPQYYSHPADLTLMRQGVRFVRSVGAAFGDVLGQELAPGPDVQTDEQIEAWLVQGAASTQYHPTGSCAMLPMAQGGVVDADLRVYGLLNVRVVDSSIFPFEFAAHLASATYGVAEQAAELLKSTSYKADGSVVPNSSSVALRGPSSIFGLCAIIFLASLSCLTPYL